MTCLISLISKINNKIKKNKNFNNFIFSVYKLQSNGVSFDTINDLLFAMDPKFADYLNVTVNDAFLINDDFSKSLINELVLGSLRVNYGQNTSVHEFVGKNFLTVNLILSFIFTL